MHTTDAESLRHEVEVLREQNESLERSLLGAQRLATVGHLASRMAHEFNNILTLIIGRAEQALKYADPAMMEKACSKTVEHGHRAADIVANLLGYATGRQTVSERIPADALMDAAVSLIAWDLAKDNIQLVRSYESSDRVRVVPGRMEQVLLNLILNARKAMASRGGTLTVAVEPSDTPGYVDLKVRDTGCGIAPEHIDRIFDPFFTTGCSNGRSTEECGTGLGLPVARDLVRQAGGEIHVSSTLGAGSTFSVLLPVCDEAAPAAEADAS